MHKYMYDGPVLSFDTLIADHWRGETRAPSESKAKSNLKYQFKKQNNKIAGSKIELPGKIMSVDWKEITNGRLQTKFS